MFRFGRSPRPPFGSERYSFVGSAGTAPGKGGGLRANLHNFDLGGKKTSEIQLILRLYLRERITFFALRSREY